jgi:F0F1-type ATP synthase epsilon subunit
MKTKIVQLTGVLFQGDASAVNVHTASGEITLLDHHQPILSVLKDHSRIRVNTAAGTEEFETRGGFLHLNGNNELTVLVD